MARVRETRDGRDNDARFGSRMRGSGTHAELLRHRFDMQYRRLGFSPLPPLVTALFRPPADAAQGDLFDRAG